MAGDGAKTFLYVLVVLFGILFLWGVIVVAVPDWHSSNTDCKAYVWYLDIWWCIASGLVVTWCIYGLVSLSSDSETWSTLASSTPKGDVRRIHHDALHMKYHTHASGAETRSLVDAHAIPIAPAASPPAASCPPGPTRAEQNILRLVQGREIKYFPLASLVIFAIVCLIVIAIPFVWSFILMLPGDAQPYACVDAYTEILQIYFITCFLITVLFSGVMAALFCFVIMSAVSIVRQISKT